MQNTLAKKRALITGGASGIGEDIACLFRELGAAVCIADSRLDAQIAHDELALSGDVSSPEDVSRMVAEATARMGAIDVLVNCAGIADVLTPTVEQDISSWRRIIDVNLTDTYLMCRVVGAHMLDRQSGSIINISSIVGLGGFPRRNGYGALTACALIALRLVMFIRHF